MSPLVLLLTLTSTIVLSSGDRIRVEGPVTTEGRVVTFRSEGRLYSMPSSEIARIETGEEKPAEAPKKSVEPEPVRKLRLSEEARKRVLADLERNHGGTPMSKAQQTIESAPDPPTAAEKREEKRAESEWRQEARAKEEAVRRAEEELQLLEERIEELQYKIQSLVSLGYKPSQFTYDTTQLTRAQEQLPYARLEVTRAQRAFDQFREDARREGVPPGWLR